MRARLAVPLLAGLAVLLFSSCRDGLIDPRELIPPEPPVTPGVMEVTISGIGTEGISASIAPLTGPSPAFSLSGNGDGTIQLSPLATGSFTEGERGSGGVRYVYASFRVRNAASDGTAYSTPRENLTFMAVSSSGTLSGSAVSSMRRFDGSAADPAIALQTLPTGAVHRSPDGAIVSSGPDVLQVITEAEVAALSVPAGVDLLPYGFVVRNPGTSGSRTLPASPAPDAFDGVVTFAFRLPLQASAAADPFTITIRVLPLDDSVTRLTRSLEEQGDGEDAFEQRAVALGASTVTLLGGGVYTGGAAVRTICEVRVAGPSGSPAAVLSSGAPCTPTGMSITWTGAVSGAWDEPGNWSPQRVPGARDTAVVVEAPNQPELAGHRSVGALNMTQGTGTLLDLAGYTLTVESAVTATFGAVVNGLVHLAGSPAALSGEVDALMVTGTAVVAGPTTTTGAVSVTGRLTLADQPLTISIP